MSRTRTGNQQIFNLQHPHPVAFDFSDSSSTGRLLITIPGDSAWTCQMHWHYTVEACEDIWQISGQTQSQHGSIMGWGSGTGFIGGPNHVLPVAPLMYVSWKRNLHNAATAHQAAVVYYKFVSPKNFDMYRQICSANQDAELYFSLRTTPFWLRATFTFWNYIPVLGKAVTELLIAWCLWVQLRVIYAKNDYWTYEGRIPYTTPWHLRHLFDAKPPSELLKKEKRSMVMISGCVKDSCHWIGTRMLGMKDEYDEYRSEEDGGKNEKEDLIVL